MSRVAAAFGVVPQDLGIIDDVNRANGETQVDVQFRVNTLPWVRFVESILNRYVQTSLGLPVKVTLDTGGETEDRLADAQVWQLAVANGACPPTSGGRSSSVCRSTTNGPSLAGSCRPGSGSCRSSPWNASPDRSTRRRPRRPTACRSTGPVRGHRRCDAGQAARRHVVQAGTVRPEERSSRTSSSRTGDTAVVADPSAPVAKADTVGVTTDTGLSGVDQVGHDDEDDDEQLVKSELAAFRKFTQTRRKRGTWRDFQFTATSAVDAHDLNDAGRAQVRKAAGDLVAAGLASGAADTGRVLMLQRALDDSDPPAGRSSSPAATSRATRRRCRPQAVSGRRRPACRCLVRHDRFVVVVWRLPGHRVHGRPGVVGAGSAVTRHREPGRPRRGRCRGDPVGRPGCADREPDGPSRARGGPRPGAAAAAAGHGQPRRGYAADDPDMTAWEAHAHAERMIADGHRRR